MPVPDPVQALEDVNEEGLLPNPVKLCDMLFHAKLAADQSLELNRQFTEYQKQKLYVRPGITCLWQVSGRNNLKDFDEWVRLDLEYIRNWSPWLDLSILFRTVGAVVSGSGK